MSWPKFKLGDIFEIARGGSPRPIDDYFTEENDGVKWISIKDASNGSKYITHTSKKIKSSGVARSREVFPGDLLLTNSMSFGRPYILKTSGCIHDGWLVLRGDPTVIDQDYFYHLLGSDSMYRNFSKLAAGAVVKNLNIDLVKTVEVPLPPLPEQRRIAAILDKAEALRTKRREAIAKLDQLLQSVFLEMFGDPVTNSKKWPKAPLEDLIQIDAPLVDPNLPEYENLLHYGPDRIEKITGKLLPAQTAKADSLISKKFLCNESHILYSKIRPNLNKVALCQQVCLCSADVYPIKVNSNLNRVYLWFILRSEDFLKYTLSFSNRANIPKINRDQLFGYECIIPDYKLQVEFGSRVNDLMKTMDRFEESKRSINKLLSSVQHNFF